MTSPSGTSHSRNAGRDLLGELLTGAPAAAAYAGARDHEADELARAIEAGQLRLFFQPDIALADDTAAGAEALVRWAHPERGILPPGEFIGLAERTGLIVPLGEWVLDEACRSAAAWRGRLDGLSISVNVSPKQIAAGSLLPSVAAALERSGLLPRRLCLEITETVLMNDVDASVGVLLGLRELGVRVAVDDFGTGYSSLSYLRRLPVDVVKVDRSFVAELGTDPASDAIVAAVINLSHALGFAVVGEGVETQDQLMALRALGCDRAQGYHWSPPLPADEFAAWVETPRPSSLAAARVDVDRLLAERVAAFRADTGRSLLLQLPRRLRSAVADPRAARHVLDQLLANARAFSEAESPIVITAASDRRWVRFSVADYGIGMEVAEAARCFEPFWQAEQHTKLGRPRTGTGMGLYLARSLVEAMGGRIGVKTAVGKGSTFTVALPRTVRGTSLSRTCPRERGVGEDSSIQEFMRQIGVSPRREI